MQGLGNPCEPLEEVPRKVEEQCPICLEKVNNVESADSSMTADTNMETETSDDCMDTSSG